MQTNDLDVLLDLEQEAATAAQGVESARAAVKAEEERRAGTQRDLAAIGDKIRQTHPDAGTFEKHVAAREVVRARGEAIDERVKGARAAVTQAELAYDAATARAQKAELAYAAKCLHAQTEAVTAMARRHDSEICLLLREHEELWLSTRRLALGHGGSEPRSPWLKAAGHARSGGARVWRGEELARALDGLDDKERVASHAAAQEESRERLALRLLSGSDVPPGLGTSRLAGPGNPVGPHIADQ